MSVTVGMKAKAEAVVNDQNTAISAGSGTLPVFATPWMCALMEQAAWTAVAPGLAQGESTVGTKLNISGTTRAAVVLSVMATILIGVWPEKLAELTNLAANTFLH